MTTLLFCEGVVGTALSVWHVRTCECWQCKRASPSCPNSSRGNMFVCLFRSILDVTDNRTFTIFFFSIETKKNNNNIILFFVSPDIATHFSFWTPSKRKRKETALTKCRDIFGWSWFYFAFPKLVKTTSKENEREKVLRFSCFVILISLFP